VSKYYTDRREWKLSEAEPVIGNGWIALYRGSGVISKIIQAYTGGPYSHAAMIRKNNGHCDVLELREFYGGRAVTLQSQVESFPGSIDVYSPNMICWPEYQHRNAVEVMRYLTGRKYGYLAVARLALMRLPLMRMIWPLYLDDPDITDHAKVGAPNCSHAVCAACRLGGGVDPVPRKPDHLVTPNDLSWSLLFKFEGVLVP
jgi:hypothetical protein